MQIILENQWTTEVPRSYNHYSGKCTKYWLTSCQLLVLHSGPIILKLLLPIYQKYLKIRPKTRQFIKILKTKWNTEVSRSYTQVLRQFYTILTDLLAILVLYSGPFILVNDYCQFTQNCLNSTTLKLLLNAISYLRNYFLKLPQRPY